MGRRWGDGRIDACIDRCSAGLFDRDERRLGQHRIGQIRSHVMQQEVAEQSLDRPEFFDVALRAADRAKLCSSVFDQIASCALRWSDKTRRRQ
jgi:hypothetical protein